MGSFESTGRSLDQYLHDLTVFLNDVTDRLAALEAKVGSGEPGGRGDKTPPPPPGGGDN